MSRTRQLIIAFWVFIVIMLLWQFYIYDKGITTAATTHPTQEHFYFIHTNAPTSVAPPVEHQGAFVQQTNFAVQNDVPATGSFTCQVTLKNLGHAKAAGVQVSVRPFRGTPPATRTWASRRSRRSDNSALAQFGQWLNFPDLGPGESSTQSVIFLSRPGVEPGPTRTLKSPSPRRRAPSSNPPPPAPHPPRDGRASPPGAWGAITFKLL